MFLQLEDHRVNSSIRLTSALFVTVEAHEGLDPTKKSQCRLLREATGANISSSYIQQGGSQRGAGVGVAALTIVPKAATTLSESVSVLADHSLCPSSVGARYVSEAHVGSVSGTGVINQGGWKPPPPTAEAALRGAMWIQQQATQCVFHAGMKPPPPGAHSAPRGPFGLHNGQT